MSEFWQLVDDEFGSAYGRVLARSHVLRTLGDRTATEALDSGVRPRDVWLALCVDLQVPESRRLGIDRPAGETKEP